MNKRIRKGLIDLLCIGDKLNLVVGYQRSNEDLEFYLEKATILSLPYKLHNGLAININYNFGTMNLNMKNIYEYEGQLYYSGAEFEFEAIERIKEAVKNGPKK